MTANDAFLHAGVRDSLDDPDREAALAMFAAMECASLRLLILKHLSRYAVAGAEVSSR